MSAVTIFGYASLINEESLRTTVPNAAGIRAAYIEGFRREFSKLNAQGFLETNLDLAGIPYCALNVAAGPRSAAVNGVVFEVGHDYFDDLKRREEGYDLIETTAYGFADRKPIGSCFVFSASDPTGRYVYDNPAQQRYLETCVHGARSHGQPFLDDFLASTFLDDAALADLPKLVP